MKLINPLRCKIKLGVLKIYSSVLFVILMVDTALAQPYGLARERSKVNAQNSSSEVQLIYKSVLKLVKESELTGDDKHDGFTVDLVINAQTQWEKYRDTQCSLKTHLEIYPETGMLYMQTYNYCVTDMNREQLVYLNNIKNILKASF